MNKTSLCNEIYEKKFRDFFSSNIGKNSIFYYNRSENKKMKDRKLKLGFRNFEN